MNVVRYSAHADHRTTDGIERAPEVGEGPLAHLGDQEGFTVLGAENDMNEDPRQGLGHD